MVTSYRRMYCGVNEWTKLTASHMETNGYPCVKIFCFLKIKFLSSPSDWGWWIQWNTFLSSSYVFSRSCSTLHLQTLPLRNQSQHDIWSVLINIAFSKNSMMDFNKHILTIETCRYSGSQKVKFAQESNGCANSSEFIHPTIAQDVLYPTMHMTRTLCRLCTTPTHNFGFLHLRT